MLAWLWNRVLKHRDDWPCRLVYCLPMRTLVEQTRQNVDLWLDNLDFVDKVGVHVLMGGEDDSDWDIHPERDAVLVGTQDMLLSRALNRGYGMKRYRWPMQFGLLNNDCLWIMDEVQLMGPGLWTSAQLDWMRSKRFESIKPCATWWMSATIRPEFLDTLDRKNAKMPSPTPLQLSLHDEKHTILQACRPCEIWKVPAMTRKKTHTKASTANPKITFTEALANAVVMEHCVASLSLVVCNTVNMAQKTYIEIKKIYKGTDKVILLTSRFRPKDREENQGKLLTFEMMRRRSKKDESIVVHGLICISTQVIEAGIDVSARRLWSEIAPWPSIVQRLGRLNRDSEQNLDSRAFFWDTPVQGKTVQGKTGPYDANAVKLGNELIDELAKLYRRDKTLSAKDALARLSTQKQSTEKVKKALTPPHEICPRAIDVHGLFSTESDVFGGFTDVSPFVRNQDENPDVTVFWREFSSKNQPTYSEKLTGPAFSRLEGCPVAIGRFREFMEKSKKAWIWNDKTERWGSTNASEIRPGMLVMLPRSAGGYSNETGWTGCEGDKLQDVPPPGELHERFDDDRYSESGFWVELGDHLRDTKNEATRIVEAVKLNKKVGAAVIHASLEHDIGKALPQWQGELPKASPRKNVVWAKAPYQFAIIADADSVAEEVESILQKMCIRIRRTDPWAEMTVKSKAGETKYGWHVDSRISRENIEQLLTKPRVHRVWNVPFRPDLRHEAATALALWHSYYRQGNRDFTALSIYLAAAHHGKVRTVLTARTTSGENVCGIAKTTVQLPWGDMPLDFECAVDGASGYFSEDGSEFIFEAPGWTGLVNDLLGGWEYDAAQGVSGAVPDDEPRNLGPFGLAYLEALVRCADAQASKNPSVKRDINT